MLPTSRNCSILSLWPQHNNQEYKSTEVQSTMATPDTQFKTIEIEAQGTNSRHGGL